MSMDTQTSFLHGFSLVPESVTFDHASLLELNYGSDFDDIVFILITLIESSGSTFRAPLHASIFGAIPESLSLSFLHRTPLQQFSLTYTASPSTSNQVAVR